MNNSLGKNIALMLLIGALLAMLFNTFQSGGTAQVPTSMPFSDFVKIVDEGKVADVAIKGRIVTGHLSEGGVGFETYLPEDAAAEMYLTRCRELHDRPPGPDWDGVFRVLHK